jgi:cytochrome c oxidase subunit II
VGSSRWLPVASATGVALLLSACVDHVVQDPVDERFAHPQDFIRDPIGRSAIQVDELWNLVFWIAVAVFVLVMGILVAAILRYRERPDDDGALPKQIHGNPRLEAVWTVIPAVILAVVAVPTVRTIFDLAEQPDDALTISVVAHQFWWEFEYPEPAGLVTANIAYIPTGTEILLEMTSADVIHSFWVPKLAGKQDVVPGHTNYLRLYTEEEGEFLGQCAEFCGVSHANMRMRIIAVSPEEFDAWAEASAEPVTAAQPGTAEHRGEILFGEFCVACHQVRGFELQGDDQEVLAVLEEFGWQESRIERFAGRGRITATSRVGPDLTNFWDREWFAGAIFRTTEEHLRDWLDNPSRMKPQEPQLGTIMPDFSRLSDEEMDALVAYLQSLRTE